MQDFAALLSSIKPTAITRVYDAVQAAGLDVSDWPNYKNGKRAPASNPKYIYEWAFASDGDRVVLNLWHANLDVDDEGIFSDLDMRSYASEIERARDEPWRMIPAKPQWAHRARSFDRTLQTSWRGSRQVRIVLCEGTMRDHASGDEKSSEVKYRALDTAIWDMVSYNWDTGKARVRRRTTGIFALTDHKTSWIASAATQAVSWNAWLADSKRAKNDWVSAGGDLAGYLPASQDGLQPEKEHVNDTGPAYWIELRQPLTGIQMVAFLLQKDIEPVQVSIRFWIKEDAPEVYARFARSVRLEVNGQSLVPNLEMRPMDGWKPMHDGKPVAVKGVLYTAYLDRLGNPGIDTLRSVFLQSCKYAIECHAGRLSAFQRPLDVGVASDAPEWCDDELTVQQIAALPLSETEKLALVKARINQSGFRRRLLARWGDKCSVNGYGQPDYLIAAHILPWNKCTTAHDRWNPDNGLLLPPGLDKAFELGIIGFDEKGHVILSQRARRVDVAGLLGISATLRIQDFRRFPGIAGYLEQHRELHKHSLTR